MTARNAIRMLRQSMTTESLRIKTARVWVKPNGAPILNGRILNGRINCQGCCDEGMKTVFCKQYMRYSQMRAEKSAASRGSLFGFGKLSLGMGNFRERTVRFGKFKGIILKLKLKGKQYEKQSMDKFSNRSRFIFFRSKRFSFYQEGRRTRSCADGGSEADKLCRMGNFLPCSFGGRVDNLLHSPKTVNFRFVSGRLRDLKAFKKAKKGHEQDGTGAFRLPAVNVSLSLTNIYLRDNI